MSFKKFESSSYVWFEDDKLGKGATASVYKCRHKESGDIFAVKVLNNRTSDDTKDRECSILKTLKHENVVSLLCVEKCEELAAEVIIMEYCNEGSLQSFLSKPENAFGLCESDLLTVLGDVVSGMKYMRSKKISHRDIKPSNILRSIRDDGTAVHKLADFGCSRVLKDSDQFASVVGTEEFMHPDVYSYIYDAGIAYFKEKKFKPTVDLWSFGVTMYYCITGKLPFSAYEGRNDKETMFLIISTRSPNDISGIQEQKDGAIEWSSSYPEHCRIPRELMQLFLPIQRGVFYTAEDTAWTFDYFFNEVADVLKRKKIQTVEVFSTELHSLYLSEDFRLDDIQRAVSTAAGIQLSDLLLLCNNTELDAYGTSLSFGDHSSLQNNARLGRGVAAGGPLYAFSRSKNGSKKPNSTVLLKVELEAGMDSAVAIAAVQRLLFAAQEASDRLDLINKGVLALLGHQRQSLLRRKALLDRSPFVGASGKHRMQTLSQLFTSTTNFHKLLELFSKTFFLKAPDEVSKRARALTDAITQWEEHRTKVQEFIKGHDVLVRTLSELPEDEPIAQKLKEASIEVSSFRNDVSRIQRLCQELVQQEKENKASATDNDKSDYAKKLFDGDIKRIQRLYSVCQSTIKRFEERLTAWITDDHVSYTERLEQTINDYDNITASHEQLMNDYEVVAKTKDERISDILRLAIQVQATFKDTTNRNMDIVTTEGHSYYPTAAAAAAVAAIACTTETVAGATADIARSDEPPSVRLTARKHASQTSASISSSCSLQRLQMLANRLQQETEAVIQENKRLLNRM